MMEATTWTTAHPIKKRATAGMAMAERQHAGGVIDSETLQRWARTCADSLTRQKDEINRLNVFPIPDSDTGSNMAFTMSSAVSALDHALRERERTRNRAQSTPSSTVHRRREMALTTAEVATVLAIGATKGSRGNSGVVLSQLLRGLAESAKSGPLDGTSVRDALSNSLRFVQAAIVNPVEGTVITVLRSAAAAATSAAQTSDRAGVVAHAARCAAKRALERTPSQLPVLRHAGVVDAGGRGLLVLLDELDRALAGATDATDHSHVGRPGTGAGTTSVVHKSSATIADGGTPGALSPTEIEVMFFIDGADLGELREFLTPRGDSLIVGAMTESSARIHIHTVDAGEVIEGAYERGAVSDLKVEVIHPTGPEQVRNADASRPRLRSVLAVVPSHEAATFFGKAGADTVVVTRPTINPGETECRPDERGDTYYCDLLREAITQEAVDEVVLLTNGVIDPRLIRDCVPDVVIVPSASLCAGVAAMAVHDPSQSLAADTAGMIDAAQETTTIIISDDDVVGGDPHCDLTPPPAVTHAWATVSELLATGGELVTVISGSEHWTRVVQQLPRREGAEYSFFTVEGCGAALMIGVE